MIQSIIAAVAAAVYIVLLIQFQTAAHDCLTAKYERKIHLADTRLLYWTTRSRKGCALLDSRSTACLLWIAGLRLLSPVDYWVEERLCSPRSLPGGLFALESWAAIAFRNGLMSRRRAALALTLEAPRVVAEKMGCARFPRWLLHWKSAVLGSNSAVRRVCLKHVAWKCCWCLLLGGSKAVPTSTWDIKSVWCGPLCCVCTLQQTIMCRRGSKCLKLHGEKRVLWTAGLHLIFRVDYHFMKELRSPRLAQFEVFVLESWAVIAVQRDYCVQDGLRLLHAGIAFALER